MGKSPLFSVLMANYNNSEFIPKAIDSVLSQTYPEWELIFVDDCSTDSSLDVLKAYEGDSRIKVFRNERNSGCGFTKNRCVALASGEICGFLDADDALADNAIEMVVKAHLENPEVSTVYSRYYLCDKDLNVLGISTHQCVIPDGSSFLEYKQGAISHFVSFKKDFYDRTPGISVSVKRAVDLDLYFKLEESGKTLFLDAPLYYYRRGTGNNISLDGNSDTASIWELMEAVDSYIPTPERQSDLPFLMKDLWTSNDLKSWFDYLALADNLKVDVAERGNADEKLEGQRRTWTYTWNNLPKYKDGTEITVNDGNTWIQIVPTIGSIDIVQNEINNKLLNSKLTLILYNSKLIFKYK